MSGGGVTKARDTQRYKPPQGPTGMDHKGPGLGGDNHGCGDEGTSEHMTGSPGIGGTNHGKSGTQGNH